MPQLNCRHFSGYRPCQKSKDCSESCASFRTGHPRVLIVSLEALGAVLRSTVILNPILERHPNAHITWVTQSPAQALLQSNPHIDRILTLASDDLLQLRALQFDIGYVIDKSLKAQGVISLTQITKIYGFLADPKTGAILPATPAAQELWELGLSDEKKFFINQKPETQLLIEALELGPFRRPEYHLVLTKNEQTEVMRRQAEWSHQGRYRLVALNTGTSSVIPAKRFTPSFMRDLIRHFELHSPDVRILLLGGRDETQLNQNLSEGRSNVILTPTDHGLRDGILSAATAQVIVSSDSLGMHLGIALNKWTVAWFGPTCAHEIDLYDRGRKILARVPCGPCWKRFCQKPVMCYDRIDLDEMIQAIHEGISWPQTSSFKQPSWETCSSVSHCSVSSKPTTPLDL